MSIADKAQAHALLIDGQDVLTSATRTVRDPATGEPLAEVADASPADAERAVAAARQAFRRGDWSRITPGERAAVLDRMGDLLEERADEFARVESRNTGKPLKFSSAFDVPLTIDNLRFFAAAARNLEGKAPARSGASRSASAPRSRPGTTRSTWRPGRSAPPSRPATPWSSSPPS
jgi:betaine-aldehyde dehydrogenase